MHHRQYHQCNSLQVFNAGISKRLSYDIRRLLIFWQISIYFFLVDQPHGENQTYVFQDSSATEEQRSSFEKEEGIPNKNYGWLLQRSQVWTKWWKCGWLFNQNSDQMLITTTSQKLVTLDLNIKYDMNT